MKYWAGLPKAFLALYFLASAGFAADDTTNVTNGETPSGPGYTLVFEENLRVGPDQGDNFIWPRTGTLVQADDRGYMYVTGAGENRVTVLDAEGGFVRHIGGPGQGPGEFQALTSFQILADGRGVAFENLGMVSSLTWYDKELNFVEKVKLGAGGQLYQSEILSPNGGLVFSQVVSLDQAAGKMAISSVIMDQQGAVKSQIARFENPMPTPQIVESTDNFAKFMSQMLTSEAKGLIGFATFDSDNNIYTALANTYEVTRWNPQMEKQLVISRKYKPITLTEEDIDAIVSPLADVLRTKMPAQMSHLFAESTIRKAVDMAEFPPVKHPISGLAVLEDGTLCVIHDADLVEKKMTVDLFDKNGRFLGDYTQTAPGANSFGLLFKNGYQYRIEANEDDENELVRYKYKLVPAS